MNIKDGFKELAEQLLPGSSQSTQEKVSNFKTNLNWCVTVSMVRHSACEQSRRLVTSPIHQDGGSKFLPGGLKYFHQSTVSQMFRTSVRTGFCDR